MQEIIGLVVRALLEIVVSVLLQLPGLLIVYGLVERMTCRLRVALYWQSALHFGALSLAEYGRYSGSRIEVPTAMSRHHPCLEFHGRTKKGAHVLWAPSLVSFGLSCC